MKLFNFAFIFLLLNFQYSVSFAETQTFKTANYADAKKADSFLRFDMSSTKFGLVTTSFDGFVKNYNLVGQIKNDELLAGASVEFAVQDLDTDVDGRNEKMWDHCLDFKNHPRVRITLNSAIGLNGTTTQVPAVITLRGADSSIQLTVKAIRENSRVVFDFTGELSIKALHIPDPSIVIASVKDKIKVTGHIVLADGQH